MKQILSKAGVTFPAHISDSDARGGVGITDDWGGAKTD
jgi:hypothetical protein